MRKKKYAARVMAAVLAGVMVLPGCGGQSSGETDAAGTAAEGVKEPGGETQDQGETGTSEQAENSAEETVEKPEKITFMVDGTLVSKANGQDEWVKRWEELTGIELEIIQPDHTAYYDVLGQTIARRAGKLAGCADHHFPVLYQLRQRRGFMGYDPGLGEFFGEKVWKNRE